MKNKKNLKEGRSPDVYTLHFSTRQNLVNIAHSFLLYACLEKKIALSFRINSYAFFNK